MFFACGIGRVDVSTSGNLLLASSELQCISILLFFRGRLIWLGLLKSSESDEDINPDKIRSELVFVSSESEITPEYLGRVWVFRRRVRSVDASLKK